MKIIILAAICCGACAYESTSSGMEITKDSSGNLLSFSCKYDSTAFEVSDELAKALSGVVEGIVFAKRGRALVVRSIDEERFRRFSGFSASLTIRENDVVGKITERGIQIGGKLIDVNASSFCLKALNAVK